MAKVKTVLDRVVLRPWRGPRAGTPDPTVPGVDDKCPLYWPEPQAWPRGEVSK